MARESEKVHYTLDRINNEFLNSGKGMRSVSIDLFSALIVIVELQQKQIDQLLEEVKRNSTGKRSDQIKATSIPAHGEIETTYTTFINSHPDISVEGC